MIPYEVRMVDYEHHTPWCRTLKVTIAGNLEKENNMSGKERHRGCQTARDESGYLQQVVELNF